MKEVFFEDNIDVQGKVDYPFHVFIFDSTNEDFPVAPHWHYAFELLYFTKGCANVYVTGRTYRVSSGDMILVSSREVHAITAIQNEYMEYYVVKFEPEVLFTSKRMIFESKYIIPLTFSSSNRKHHFEIKDIEETFLPGLISETNDEYSRQEYGFELAVRTNICRIFLWITRSWHQNRMPMSNNVVFDDTYYTKLKDVFVYIDQHYAEEISAGTLANMLHLSYTYFSRFFKKITGKSLTEYISFIRIIEAEKLLLSCDLDITEIAYRTGFSNSSYFIKTFKSFKNITPKNYRKAMLNASEDHKDS